MFDYESSRKLRDRAEECRVIAYTYKDRKTRALMLNIATGYDRMAEHLEQGPHAGEPLYGHPREHRGR